MYIFRMLFVPWTLISVILFVTDMVFNWDIKKKNNSTMCMDGDKWIVRLTVNRRMCIPKKLMRKNVKEKVV